MKFLNPIRGLAKTMLAFGLVSALGGTSLFAAPTVYTLAGLVSSGGTIVFGDKTFSNFGFTVTSLTSFDPTAITVTASESGGVDYLTWSGNISETSTGAALGDLALQYVVTSTGEPIDMIDQSYVLGNAINGSLDVAETVATGNFGGPVVAHSNLNINTPSQTQGPNLNVNPAQPVLYVTKDISLLVNPPAGASGSVTITQVEQSFHQVVPEPGTMLLGSLGGGLLLLLRLRQAGRNVRKP
jgi:hypothetical protein